jgi:hypothetical protein
MRFLQATGWLAVLVFVIPALGYLALLLLSRLQATTQFVVWYLAFLLVWFLAALPIVGLTWMLPPPARAALGAVIVYLIALVVPLVSAMPRYPLHIIRCGRPPLVGTTFTSGFTYKTPGSPSYAVTPLDDRFFCTPEEAAEAGFHESPLE